jgi:hypothetical protein
MSAPAKPSPPAITPATACPESSHAWTVDFALRCWTQRVWWLPVVGPLVAVWIAGGQGYLSVFQWPDVTLLLLGPSMLIMAVAVRWAGWIAAAAQRQVLDFRDGCPRERCHPQRMSRHARRS